MLFLLYINDIINATTDGNFVLYADDTNIFVIDKTRDEVYNKANRVLNHVHNYMASNLLHINMNKCNYIYFRPHIAHNTVCARGRTYLKLSINGVDIKQVTSTKFLGVIIDENLSWQPHIEHLNKKLKSCVGAIKRIKDCIPKSQFHNIYHSLFESHLSYCISVWGGISSTYLFITQKRCIRMLFGTQKDTTQVCRRVLTYEEHINPDYSLESTKPLFTSNRLLTVPNLYNYHTLIELYKILKFRTPYPMFENLRLSNRKLLLIPPRARLDKKLKNFFYKAAENWNIIHTHLVTPFLLPIKTDARDKEKFRDREIITINYDFSDKVSTVKQHLKSILLLVQCHGDDKEWQPHNFRLDTYNKNMQSQV